MSLLCAAGHMESSLYVWRRCCDGVGVGDGNWACAAIFRFLLSQTHTLTIVSFSFFADFFLFLLFFWALCTPSRLSYCPTHHTHRCWPSATLAVCLFLFFFFTIRSPLCSLHSPLSALFCTLPRWRSFIHVFSSYLWHSYSHCSATVCVCFFLSVCLCALPLCLCCLPMLLLSPPVTKISLSSFWLQSPHALALALVFYLQAGMHVCVCVYMVEERVSFTFAFRGYCDARWVYFRSRITRSAHCEAPLSLCLPASSTTAGRILSFLCVCLYTHTKAYMCMCCDK